MLAMFALITVIHHPAPQEAMTLKLKPGDKLVYELNIKAMGMDATGRMQLSVTKKDGAKYTVSWPQVDFTANKGTFQPIRAGTSVITEKGRVVTPDAGGQGVMFLIQMALPQEPLAVGGTFPIKEKIGPMPLDLTGKFEKATEGGVAVIVADGQLAGQGGQLALHWESNFDIKRGIFRGGTMTMTGSKAVLSSFSFKLVE